MSSSQAPSPLLNPLDKALKKPKRALLAVPAVLGCPCPCKPLGRIPALHPSPVRRCHRADRCVLTV